jgi:hypothetical protein
MQGKGEPGFPKALLATTFNVAKMSVRRFKNSMLAVATGPSSAMSHTKKIARRAHRSTHIERSETGFST